MGQFIITGDKAAGLEAIERLMQRSGMTAAAGAGAQGRAPREINLAIRRAHGVGDRHEEVRKTALAQIPVGAPWHSLALECMIANMSRPVWGWSDALAVPLLDYWCQVDPGVRFLLVFDRPDSVLADLDPTADAKDLDARLCRWRAVNEALLSFHLRHADRSLLVHAAQARQSVGSWARALREKLPARWSEGLQRMADYGGRLEDDACAASGRAGEPDAASWLGELVVQDFPAVHQLYEELQCSACLPLDASSTVPRPAAFHLWQQIDRQTRRLSAVEVLLADATEHTRAAEREKQALNAQIAAQAQATSRAEALLGARVAENLHLSAQLARSAEVAGEVPRLIAQLQSVHEAMEQATWAADEARTTAQSREVELRDAQRRGSETEARLEVLTAQLVERDARLAEITASSARAKDQAHENEALLNQLQAVQEALEQAQCAAQEARTAAQSRETELLSARQSSVEAEARHGALAAQLEERERRLAELSARCAHLDDLTGENKALLNQLQAVQEALERACAVPTADAAPAPAPAPAPRPTPMDAVSARHAPLGAAERVRSQLSYRLGACMIECSRTPLGWVTMPFRLMAISLAFRRERARRRERKLLPIHAYRDAHEADRVRQHLSYRLGQTLIHQLSRPVGWVGLPFALYREVGQFRSVRRA